MSTATKALLLVLFLPVWAWGAVPVIESAAYRCQRNDSLCGHAGGTDKSDTLVYAVKPSGVTTGDLLVILLMVENSSTPETYPTPTGWTKAFQQGDQVPDCNITMYWRVADGTEPSQVAVDYGTSGTNKYAGAWYLRLSGVYTASPIDSIGAVYTNSNSVPVQCPTITTLNDSCLAFFFHAFDGGDGESYTFNVGSASGWTRQDEEDAWDGSVGEIFGVAGSYGTKPIYTTGATGTVLDDPSVTDGNIGIQFSIRGTIAAATTKAQIMRTVIVGD